ncbi:MAG TPA: hypothetical protein VFV92_15190 [Candidatus Bathyarchaeia archaeon]|nr:hypothetical protein [Candidatus Bathyarchaeia archaeon]HEX4922070.1 hypothetical protein [Candidatus Bathyarchaeia archaeon]
MAQTRKQKVLGEVKKQRQRRAIATFVVVAILISVIGGVAYALSRAPGGSGFPFPCLAESVTLHVHPWLRIWIENTPGNNVSVTIPAAVGILDPQITNGLAGGGSCFEPLHTHDSTGIIHIESGSITDSYTLGDFFKVWAATPGYSNVNVPGFGSRPVVFNSSDIFGFRPDATHVLSLVVDGSNSTSYGSLPLVPLDYCSSALASTFPCSSTAGGNPAWGSGSYPYNTGHTIVIFYKAF